MGCGLSFGCCAEQDFLETDRFEVKRVIHPLPMKGPGTLVTPVSGGTMHGLLYGELNLNGHPIEADARPNNDPTKDPPAIFQPYANSFCFSHRFRKRYLTVSIATPWAGNDSGTLPYPATFNVGITIFMPWGPVTKIVAANIGPNRWQWSNLLADIFALATPTSEYDDDPSRKYEQALGTKPRDNMLARAPIFTISGGQVAQATTPNGRKWGLIKSITARGFETGQTIKRNSPTVFEVLIDLVAWEQDEAAANGETYQNWYNQNGAFVHIQSYSIAAGGDMAPYANSYITYLVTARGNRT